MQKQYSTIGLLFIFMLVFSCNKNDVEEGSQPIGKRISFSTNMGDDFDDLKNTKSSTSNEEEIVYQDASLTITASPMKIKKAVSTRGTLHDSTNIDKFMVYGYSHKGDFNDSDNGLKLEFGPLSITEDSKWMNDAAIWAGEGRKMSFFAYYMGENNKDVITIEGDNVKFPRIKYDVSKINSTKYMPDVLVANSYNKSNSVGDSAHLNFEYILSSWSFVYNVSKEIIKDSEELGSYPKFFIRTGEGAYIGGTYIDSLWKDTVSSSSSPVYEWIIDVDKKANSGTHDTLVNKDNFNMMCLPFIMKTNAFNMCIYYEKKNSDANNEATKTTKTIALPSILYKEGKNYKFEWTPN